MNRTLASGIAATHTHTHYARTWDPVQCIRSSCRTRQPTPFHIPGHRCMCLSALLSLYLHRLYLFVTYRSFPSIAMAVLYGLPGSPGADSIPFPAAIVVAVIVFLAAVIRLVGYFLPRSNQPLQLIVSIISLVSSGLLLGFVSSRNANHWCEIVYVCLLVVNIGIVGIYEVECCWQIQTTVFPQLKQILLAIGILSILLNTGLCIWFGNINKDLPLILIILLCSNCILYSFVSFSYFKLHSLGLKPHPHVLGSGILCIFIVASIGIFLGVGEANKIPGSLVSSTWIALAISSASTLRIPCRRWRSRNRQIFGCRGLSEEVLVMHGLSSRQNSSSSC